MPPKKGRGKDVIEEDNTPPSNLEIRLHCAGSANTPVRTRMGHVSYIHPKSGLLYVVGGCDVMGLPPILKSPRPVEPQEPLPFAEWWDRETRMWGVDLGGSAAFNTSHNNNNNNNNNNNKDNKDDNSDKDNNNNNGNGSKKNIDSDTSNTNNNNTKGKSSNNNSGDTAALVDTRQFSIKHHPANVPGGISWPTLAASVVHWGPVRGRVRTTFSATCTPNPSTPLVPSLLPHIDANAATAVAPTTTCTDDAIDPPVSVENTAEQNDDWSGKGGVGEESNTRNAAGEVNTSAEREHPVVLFIGGWKHDNRTSHVMGVDLDTGAVLQGRGGAAFSPLPITCSTGSVLQENLYLFGGNTTTGYSPAIKTLDLSNCKWGERGTVGRITSAGGGRITSAGGGDKRIAEPSPRSSHVAGLLLNRYMVVHGGRRLAPFPTGSSTRGKKVDAKALQTIIKPGLDFCNDVAVYDVKNGQWVISGINVGSMGPAPRYAHAACVLSPSELLFHGGIGIDGNTLSDAWILRLQEKKESTVTISWVKLIPHEEDVELLPARSHHALAKEAGEERRVYVTGGISAPGKVEDVCIIEIPSLSEMTAGQQEPRRRTLVKESKRSRP